MRVVKARARSSTVRGACPVMKSALERWSLSREEESTKQRATLAVASFHLDVTKLNVTRDAPKQRPPNPNESHIILPTARWWLAFISTTDFTSRRGSPPLAPGAGHLLRSAIDRGRSRWIWGGGRRQPSRLTVAATPSGGRTLSTAAAAAASSSAFLLSGGGGRRRHSREKPASSPKASYTIARALASAGEPASTLLASDLAPGRLPSLMIFRASAAPSEFRTDGFAGVFLRQW